MSQQEQVSNDFEDFGSQGGQDVADDSSRGLGMNQLVPVNEAIKYRKRAQAAEQQVEQLREELSEVKQREQKDRAVLEDVMLERDLTYQFLKAGATDVEAAVLLAKHRIGSSDSDAKPMSDVIESLRREKPYLFCDLSSEMAAGPTAGLRSERGGSATALNRSARRAAQSGSRKDMQEYLRLRRSVRA